MVLVDPAIPGPHVRRPEPMILGTIAALSVPGLAQNLLDRRLRALGPEGLVKNTLALVAADPSRVDASVVDAHVRLTRERIQLGRQNARAFIQASRSIAFRMADPRFWTRVSAIRAPTLIIHGALDRLIPLSAARELHRRRPDWRLEVLDGVGHVPMMEAPDRFMEVLEGWSPYRIRTAAAVS
jgi:pimeloyl-ACP methyl ester carboxylesterase